MTEGPERTAEHIALPSDIPWSTLKDEELEELVYWLLDSMGAKDLSWRVGGRTANAPDGGRDIEATMYSPDATGVPAPAQWWVEAKGRSSTVEKAAVTHAATNALGHTVDVLTVATNGRFTNPTRDWVEAFNRTHPRPHVQLWDRHELERLVGAHPLVAVRLFPDVLSPEGRLALHVERFWQRRDLMLETDLEFLWEHREIVVQRPGSLLPILISETDHGNLNRRRWLALDLSTVAIAHVLSLSLCNLLALSEIDGRRGLPNDLLVRTASSIVQAALTRMTVDSVINICMNPWQFTDSNLDPSEELMHFFMDPVVDQARYAIARSCTQDCGRVLVDFPEDFRPDDHWKRFFDAGEPEDEDDRYLIIETKDRPCGIGLGSGPEWSCPLFSSHDDWTAVMRAIEPVLEARITRLVSGLDTATE